MIHITIQIKKKCAHEHFEEGCPICQGVQSKLHKALQELMNVQLSLTLQQLATDILITQEEKGDKNA